MERETGTGAAGPVVVRPLTPERWDNLTALFGERGAYGGCWCMWWRQTSAEVNANAGERNRALFQALVHAGRVPGLLAYRDGIPVGWCSVAPRAEFGRVLRSPNLRPIDDAQPVWAIVCFYIDRAHRGQGVATALLRAAVDHAAANGARLVEGDPIDTDGARRDAAIYTGTRPMFLAAGFKVVARRKASRPIVRYTIP